MIGKKATGGDYLAFLIFVLGLFFLCILSIFIITPSMGEKQEIKVEIEEVSDNLFLYGLLRQDIDDKNMIELIALSHKKEDYNNLKEKIAGIVEKTNKETNFRVYINDKEVIEECNTKCNGKKQDFAITLPLPNQKVINFKLVLYETK